MLAAPKRADTRQSNLACHRWVRVPYGLQRRAIRPKTRMTRYTQNEIVIATSTSLIALLCEFGDYTRGQDRSGRRYSSERLIRPRGRSSAEASLVSCRSAYQPRYFELRSASTTRSTRALPSPRGVNSPRLTALA